MSIIKLAKNDPIVQRAMAVDTSTLTEVGFIPGDACGCKIYARKKGKGWVVIGMHSRIYGCNRQPRIDGVDIR